MIITMRGGEQPFLDLPPVAGEPGRHGTARRRAASYRAVFAIREFRALWWAQVVSYLADQIAQVAIAVLVYAAVLAVEWGRHRSLVTGGQQPSAAAGTASLGGRASGAGEGL